MPFSRCLAATSFLLVIGTSVSAATLETANIDNWSLAAYSNTQTGKFQSCDMSTSAGEGTEFIVSADVRDRWGLWLKRNEWPIERDAPVIATLNFDTGKKAGIAIETTRKSDRFLALPLPRGEKLPDFLDHAATVRVAVEHKLHGTASLKNYAKAIEWLKACVARRAEPQSATPPDATIRSEKNVVGRDDGTLEMEPGTKETKPPVTGPGQVKPAKDPELIEASAKSDGSPADQKPAISVAIAPQPPAEPATAKPDPQARSQPQAGSPGQIAAGIANALSTAARATTADVVEARAGNAARDLVPGLMQAAKLTRFKLLPETQAPSSLSRADAVFELEGFRAAVVSLETPSAATGMNEILAHDRIACSGVYASNSARVDAASSDVLRATTRCEAGGQVTIGHFVSLARKGGGYYVVAVTGQAPATTTEQTNPVSDVSATLDDAALAVTGKF
jgi:hypothetical protein